MLTAIEEIEGFTKGQTMDDFYGDTKSLRSVERGFEILGEAARKIPRDVQDLYPIIPWEDVISLRHVLAHDYDAIHPNIIWDTIKNDLPPLKEKLIATINGFPEVS